MGRAARWSGILEIMTVPDQVPQRIGDVDRDEAVEALQEHHALGRLDVAEFEDRMSKALEAKYASELVPLFVDLPEPHPALLGRTSNGSATPSFMPITLSNRIAASTVTPWYAQWWMILVAIALTTVSRGTLGFLVPMMAIWLWVVYPSLVAQARRRRGVGAAPTSGRPPELDDEQLSRVRDELRQGRRIAAIKAYRDFTGVDLRTARDAVERIDRQLGGR